MRISNKAILQLSYKYLKGHLWKALFIFLLILLRNAGALSFPYFLKIIIDDIFIAEDVGRLIEVLAMIAGIQLISAIIISIAKNITLNRKTIMLDRKTVMLNLFQHLLSIVTRY